MSVAAGIVVGVSVLAIAVLVIGLFFWAAVKDGQEDRRLQARLGIRRKTRLEKMDFPCEATGDWLAHLQSFPTPAILQPVEMLGRQNIECRVVAPPDAAFDCDRRWFNANDVE